MYPPLSLETERLEIFGFDVHLDNSEKRMCRELTPPHSFHVELLACRVSHITVRRAAG